MGTHTSLPAHHSLSQASPICYDRPMANADMKLGIFGINIGICAEPAALASTARAAEAAGFDSLWTGEHVVLPDPQKPPSPVPPDFPFLDPAIALAFAAAHTSTIALATGIIILPQRNPLVLAKELASVDVLSNGRLMFGIGVGYLEAEFRALGVPFEDKGARTMDYLRAIQSIWRDAEPAHQGRFVSFRGVQARPRPVQQPWPPIVFGGHSPVSLGRAVKHGNGWYGFSLDVEQAAACIGGLRDAAARSDRSSSLGRLEITVTPPPMVPVDLELARRYRDVGVDRLVPYPLVGSATDLETYIADLAENVIDRL